MKIEQLPKAFFTSEHVGNIQVQKERFLKHGKTPIFVVQGDTASVEELANKANGQIRFEFLGEAEYILRKVKEEYGVGENYLDHIYGPPITQDEANDILMDYINENSLHESLDVFWSYSMTCSARMVWKGLNNKCNKPELRRYSLWLNGTNENPYLRRTGFLCLLDHEIGTHFFRTFNDGLQPWFSDRKRFDLRSCYSFESQCTEEGLAAIHTAMRAGEHYLWLAALVYYTACKSTEMTFRQLFDHLGQFICNPEQRWKHVMRVKRGLVDPNDLGGYGKDQCYFEGAVNILRNIDNIDFTLLMSGKVCYDEVKRVRRVARLNCIRLPAFMRSMEKYRQKLKQMAILNGLDLKHPQYGPSPAYLRRLQQRQGGHRSRPKKVRKQKKLRASRSKLSHAGSYLSSTSLDTSKDVTSSESRDSILPFHMNSLLAGYERGDQVEQEQAEELNKTQTPSGGLAHQIGASLMDKYQAKTNVSGEKETVRNPVSKAAAEVGDDDLFKRNRMQAGCVLCKTNKTPSVRPGTLKTQSDVTNLMKKHDSTLNKKSDMTFVNESTTGRSGGEADLPVPELSVGKKTCKAGSGPVTAPSKVDQVSPDDTGKDDSSTHVNQVFISGCEPSDLTPPIHWTSSESSQVLLVPDILICGESSVLSTGTCRSTTHFMSVSDDSHFAGKVALAGCLGERACVLLASHKPVTVQSDQPEDKIYDDEPGGQVESYSTNVSCTSDAFGVSPVTSVGEHSETYLGLGKGAKLHSGKSHTGKTQMGESLVGELSVGKMSIGEMTTGEAVSQSERNICGHVVGETEALSTSDELSTCGGMAGKAASLKHAEREASSLGSCSTEVMAAGEPLSSADLVSWHGTLTEQMRDKLNVQGSEQLSTSEPVKQIMVYNEGQLSSTERIKQTCACLAKAEEVKQISTTAADHSADCEVMKQPLLNNTSQLTNGCSLQSTKRTSFSKILAVKSARKSVAFSAAQLSAGDLKLSRVTDTSHLSAGSSTKIVASRIAAVEQIYSELCKKQTSVHDSLKGVEGNKTVSDLSLNDPEIGETSQPCTPGAGRLSEMRSVTKMSGEKTESSSPRRQSSSSPVKKVAKASRRQMSTIDAKRKSAKYVASKAPTSGAIKQTKWHRIGVRTKPSSGDPAEKAETASSADCIKSSLNSNECRQSRSHLVQVIIPVAACKPFQGTENVLETCSTTRTCIDDSMENAEATSTVRSCTITSKGRAEINNTCTSACRTSVEMSDMTNTGDFSTSSSDEKSGVLQEYAEVTRKCAQVTRECASVSRELAGFTGDWTVKAEGVDMAQTKGTCVQISFGDAAKIALSAVARCSNSPTTGMAKTTVPGSTKQTVKKKIERLLSAESMDDTGVCAKSRFLGCGSQDMAHDLPQRFRPFSEDTLKMCDDPEAILSVESKCGPGTVNQKECPPRKCTSYTGKKAKVKKFRRPLTSGCVRRSEGTHQHRQLAKKMRKPSKSLAWSEGSEMKHLPSYSSSDVVRWKWSDKTNPSGPSPDTAVERANEAGNCSQRTSLCKSFFTYVRKRSGDTSSSHDAVKRSKTYYQLHSDESETSKTQHLSLSSEVSERSRSQHKLLIHNAVIKSKNRQYHTASKTENQYESSFDNLLKRSKTRHRPHTANVLKRVENQSRLSTGDLVARGKNYRRPHTADRVKRSDNHQRHLTSNASEHQKTSKSMHLFTNNAAKLSKVVRKLPKVFTGKGKSSEDSQPQCIEDEIKRLEYSHRPDKHSNRSAKIHDKPLRSPHSLPSICQTSASSNNHPGQKKELVTASAWDAREIASSGQEADGKPKNSPKHVKEQIIVCVKESPPCVQFLRKGEVRTRMDQQKHHSHIPLPKVLTKKRTRKKKSKGQSLSAGPGTSTENNQSCQDLYSSFHLLNNDDSGGLPGADACSQPSQRTGRTGGKSLGAVDADIDISADCQQQGAFMRSSGHKVRKKRRRRPKSAI